jgi:hypothetical protein
MRRFRAVLFVFALTLTSLALGPGPRARAAECTDGNRGWVDFGSCCFPYNVVQLLPAICVDGYWEYDSSRSGYKCVFSEPC